MCIHVTIKKNIYTYCYKRICISAFYVQNKKHKNTKKIQENGVDKFFGFSYNQIQLQNFETNIESILNQLNRINYLSYLIIVIINVYILVTYVYVFFIYKDKPFISLFLFTLNKPLM